MEALKQKFVTEKEECRPEQYALMLKTLADPQTLGREIAQTRGEATYFKDRLKKLGREELLAILEICGTASGGGGSERKVTRIVSAMFPEVTVLTRGSNFIDTLCEHFVQTAMQRFAEEFHVIADEAVTVNVAAFRKLVKTELAGEMEL